MADDKRSRDSELAEAIGASGWTVAVAESLTSGKIAATLGAAPAAGEWFRGGVVAYATEVKRRVLGMPDCSPVCAEAARAMAAGVRSMMRADIAVAVTGVGGPDSQDGAKPGSVWLAIATPDGTRAVYEEFAGEPVDVVHRTVRRALELLHHDVTHSPPTSG
ncbi:nicotinamide-nucleotide amidase [Nocardia transvalensis]|uniref:Nicotinamide-nucleotide amidase n=1 Tax=Nocardia transvalensis TaxID=37333 RepID=A0A7W9UK00_9NOCA|nr:CinA family protein [Nocardia transvalensis]MBB5916023.1 nicotinamide-nucleotide amidase [Nocardia transvalensis]